MAAVLIRRGTGLCCIHRRLCRVFWRSQPAPFSSKPSDSKQQRRTHIKKAKPQPAVDVAELLEKLFSQRRPSATSPAAKARPPKPPSTSSLNVSSSSVPPLSQTEAAMSAVPAAPSLDVRILSKVTSDSSSSDAAAVEYQTRTGPVETKVETSSEPAVVEMSSSPAASVEPLIELTLEPSVEHILPPVDTREVTSPDKHKQEPVIETVIESVEASTAPVQTPETRSAVEPTLEAIVAQNETEIMDISHDAAVESLIEVTIEPTVEHILSPVDTQEITSAVVEPVEAPTKDTNPDMVDPSHKLEPLIETVIESVEVSYAPVQTPEIRSAVEPTIEEEETKNTDSGVVDISHGAAVEPLIEVTLEPSAEHILPLIETQEVTSAVVDPIEAPTKDTDPDMVDPSHKQEPLIDTVMESVEVSNSPPETRYDVVWGPVELTIGDIVAQKVGTKNTDSGVVDISHGATVEPLIEVAIESPVERSYSPVETPETRYSIVGGPVEPLIAAMAAQKETKNMDTGVVDISHGAAVGPLIEPTVEHILPLIETQVKDPGMVEPLIESPVEVSYSPVGTPETRGAIVGGPVEPTIEYRVAQKLETKNTDSGVVDISHGATVEASVEVTSAESRSAVAEGSAHSVPTNCTDSGVLNVSHRAGQEPLIETTGTTTMSDGAVEETVTLEPLTLAKVTFEAEEKRNALEKEDDVSPNEEKVDVTTKEDVEVFEDTTETEILVSESETSVLLEAVPGSDKGQEEGRDAEQQEGRVEAMTLESVTLAEVQASLGALESESLTEAARYLETEAEFAAGERRAEVDDAAASEETLSLPEATALSEDLQIDVLMEELLFTLPGHVAEGQTGQDIVKAADVDAAVAVNDDAPASPALTEVLQEVEEQGAHAEASGIEDAEETHTNLDPVQRLFLEKIKEYNTQRLNRGLLEAEPEYNKYLSEEVAKLQRLHGGGDLSSFPQFTFTEPQMDQDSK